MIDYRQFADDEGYLFGVVAPRFASQGWLGAFDVMAVARWKAERARIYFARRLVSRGAATLDAGARALTRSLAAASTDEDRFRVVCGDWGFPLPTGSALLTVCFPDAFSVYDVRVCSQLDAFHNLGARTNVASLWQGYTEFLAAVRSAAPARLTLRECDRWLWGRSRHEDLETLVSELRSGDKLRRGAR